MSLAKQLRFLIYCIRQLPFVCYSTVQYLLLSRFQDARTKRELEDLSLRIHLVTQVIKKSTQDVDTVTIEQTQGLLGAPQPPRKHEVGIPLVISYSQPAEIEEMVDAAVLALCPDSIGPAVIQKSKYASCKAEWQGARVNAAHDYASYFAECPNKDAVLLYFHGGGFMFGTEHGHRTFVARLQKRFGGRALSVRYRLSPQHKFPAALTDALTAYFFLTNPPAGSAHKAVPPSQIVLGGDSAGGNLAIALYTTLLQQKQPLPGGLLLISPWLDLTHSFPSCRHKRHDYLPVIFPEDAGTLLKQHKDSPSWPLQGRSRQVYTVDDMLLHPLVSPVLVPEVWSELQASPNVCLQIGSEEILLDENRDFARAIADVSHCLFYDEYKSMPHVFQVFAGHHKSALLSLDIMAKFIKDCAAGQARGQAFSRRALPYEKVTLYADASLLPVQPLQEKQEKMHAAVAEAQEHRRRSTEHSQRQARL
jgi:acetyl esterase/lipase